MQLSPERAAAEVMYRREIRGSLVKWAEHCGFKPAAHHRLLIEHLEKVASGEILRLAVFMPPGSAKALALDTPIPTPQGWATMGSLRVGDRVFDEQGLPCDVVRVSQVFRDRPVYRVVTDCGDEIIADSDHEWLVRMCGKRDVFKLHTTETLAHRRAKRPMIRKALALELPAVELPIDPYVLGFWLGDGTSALPQLTIGDQDAEQLVAILIDCGVELRKNSPRYRYHMHGMRSRFVALGLLHDPSHTTFGKKYIPAIYLRASAEQRLALLQGLVDSDGNVSRSQPGYVTFSNTDKALAEQVRELVRSLGVKAGWIESRAVVAGKDCGPHYRVSFYHERAARLPRKAALCRHQTRTPGTYVEAIPAGIADTICIEVNSPSHLFLAGRSMTPTHNSTYASILFPSWLLSQDPKAQFLAASHTTELAERWGRRVRNLVTENTSVLKVTLSEEQAVGRWGLAEGGEYMAAGANVGIAGFRAKYGLIDDPIRSRQDADSVLVRDRIWDWYLNDFRPRLIPHARQVLIQTRWHEDDLAGRCLNHQPWTVLSLPAFAKSDDQLGRAIDQPLWADDDYGYGDQLVSLRDTTPPRIWSALYQQEPSPDTGDYFKEDWLHPVDILPDRSTMRTYGASDYAVTGDGGDYTVHVVFGLDHLNHLYLLDVWRGQKKADVWVDAMCDLVQKYRPLAWAEEGGQIKSGIGPFLDRQMRERRVYVNRTSFPTRGDKSIRARSIQGRMALDGLYYPKRAPWVADWLAELLNFPASKHDDQCDAMGLAGQLLDQMVKGRAGTPAVFVKPKDGYKSVRDRIKTVDAMTL